MLGGSVALARLRRIFMMGLVLLVFMPAAAGQEPPANNNPTGLNLFNGLRDAAEPEQLSTTRIIFVLLTVLSMAPAIIMMTTSFTRIIVVFGFLRQAMATQQTPPTQVLVGLALILTFFIMQPTYRAVWDDAVAPYVDQQITQQEALDRGMKPIRDFMFRQVRPNDVALFLQIGKIERPATPDDVPLHVLVPAFVISELRIAFQIGFIIYIPFLIIDMVVASTLMAMGMMMLPPVFISLPFKIILFVLVDGWTLLIGELVRSFN